jgi:hypothetical protein
MGILATGKSDGWASWQQESLTDGHPGNRKVCKMGYLSDSGSLTNNELYSDRQVKWVCDLFRKSEYFFIQMITLSSNQVRSLNVSKTLSCSQVITLILSSGRMTTVGVDIQPDCITHLRITIADFGPENAYLKGQ